MPIVRRRFLAGTLLLPVAVQADQAQESWEDKHQRQLKEDWPWLGRYAADNRKLIAAGQKVDIVFMGDSITEGWQSKHPAFFTPGRICRGIGGQTSPQMVLRMMADVIALKPRLVHIMAGTNDIAGNTGTISIAQSCDNLRMMTELAQANGIHVLLASVPPADHFPWRPGLATVEPIRAINRWQASYARRARATFIDYTGVLGTAAGGMKPGLASDGVHPTEAGYAAMEAVLAPVLKAHKA
ncbi:GDSL-type esterase/lipase family protein [Sphingomonas sp. KR3-1]|uniref:GDSL-type esterase/lipase family protein n=1 Tax=Sphingomonas sp. KR3-1 TaxID=3156611 RepID=UPI0032B3FFCC